MYFVTIKNYYRFDWAFPTAADLFLVIGAADPQIINCSHADHQTALPWPLIVL